MANNMTGKELSAHGKDAFTKTRPAVVFYNMNSHRPTGRGAKGLFDHMLIDTERGWIAFVEVKGAGDKFRDAQNIFADAVLSICGLTPHVVYRVVRQPEDWDFLLNYRVASRDTE